MKLENLTGKYFRPCIMDIKIGYITWEANASPEKIARAKRKFNPQSEVGFQLKGMRVRFALLFFERDFHLYKGLVQYILIKQFNKLLC